ncbi:ATP-dependent endonuclease [Nitrosomonas sp. Nm166]|uniref:ATP-dependent nuclease n=1 Tax=Nitrosomonas sp. Nm166 TaxID=1881054 RepID=UPI0008E3D3D2|nr:AAA family ATPase [Nitrosomonas sp. Nm166]SFE67416.1 Predicted ATP-dependent endonuclease of the OLD family, contains P-loop ATPase and TOPRIM domains [Nitrosomonas sp. Nm166]
MKLTHISIHNFRGIIDASMAFQPYALVVGANNSGKSTIIDCIRAFYEKDGFKFKKEVDVPLKGAVNQESWVELIFSLDDEEHESLKDEYKTAEKSLKVRKYFQTGEKLHDGKNATGSILGYKTDGTLSNEPFYGAKNVQSGKFGDLIYIPAISKVDEHTKLSGPSALRDLITNIMSDVVEGSDAYKTLTESVTTFAGSVRAIETEDKRSLSNFENDLNALLAPWQTNFNLKFTTPSTAEIIKSMLGWDIRDNHHEKPQGVEYFGSGFQRHFIYSLIQLGAKYIPQKVSKKEKDFAPSLNLVLFEEPEAFLHPPQQEDLARNLIKVSEAADWQIVCSTHSAHFVSRNAMRIPAIVRARRVDGIVSTFQIDDAHWSNIVDANHAIQQVAAKYPKVQKTMQADDLKPEMESVKYFLWLNPDRAGMLFAQNVLLVEGPSETALINRLLDKTVSCLFLKASMFWIVSANTIFTGL